MPEEYGSLKLKVPKSEGEAPDGPKAFKEFADSIAKPPTGAKNQVAIVQSDGSIVYKTIKGDGTLEQDGTLTLPAGAVVPSKIGTLPSCKVSTPNTLAITSEAIAIPFSSEVWDTSSMHDTSSEALQKKLAAPIDGLYELNAYISWVKSPDKETTKRLLRARIGGSGTYLLNSKNVSGEAPDFSQELSAPVRLKASEYVEILAGTSGASTSLVNLPTVNHWASLVWVGPYPS